MIVAVAAAVVLVVVMLMCEVRIVFNAIASAKHRPTPFQTGRATGDGPNGKICRVIQNKARGRASKNAIVYERAIERINRLCVCVFHLCVYLPAVCANSHIKLIETTSIKISSYVYVSTEHSQTLLIGSDAVETLSIRESNHKSSTIGRIKPMARRKKKNLFFPQLCGIHYTHTHTHNLTHIPNFQLHMWATGNAIH